MPCRAVILSGRLGGLQSLEVTLVLLGIRLGEVGDGAIERLA